MARDGLGELEHQTMLALLQLGDEAYTAQVAAELEARTDRRTTVAAVYIVLRRLEKKGLVASVMRDTDAAVSRDRRWFEVTKLGLESLRRARDAYSSLWDGLEAVFAKGR